MASTKGKLGPYAHGQLIEQLNTCKGDALELCWVITIRKLARGSVSTHWMETAVKNENVTEYRYALVESGSHGNRPAKRYPT
ncbi:MAG: hypothetical protein ACLUTU_00555 [Blautia faecis]